MKVPGVLRHLTLACALVYLFSIVLGAVTLLPGITTDLQTAVLLILYRICFSSSRLNSSGQPAAAARDTR